MRTMTLRLLGGLLAPALLAAATLAGAAATGVASGSERQSVRSGQNLVISAIFKTASGAAAAGESVTFRSDTCGNFTNPTQQPFKPDARNETVSVANASGIAIATLIAVTSPTTFGCSIVATAGEARVVFTIIVYNMADVQVSVGNDPAEPGPGQPFTVIVQVRSGLLAVPGIDTRLAIAPTSTATGVITSPPGVRTDGSGTIRFGVAPHTSGRFDFEATVQNGTGRLSLTPTQVPYTYTDIWWAGFAESGWGMSITQKDGRFFNVIYAYDSTGRATWYVMPGGTWDAANQRLTGALYAPRGTPYFQYNAASLAVGSPVGMATLTFGNSNLAVLEYTIAGASGVKRLERQPFAIENTAPGFAFVGGMWWGQSAQNGWGVAMMQQYGALFIVWFTYDEAGRPTWFVMPSGGLAGTPGSGRIFRTSGPSWLGTAFNPGAVQVADVGSFALSFPAMSNVAQFPPPDFATLQYQVDGRSGTLNLRRQPF